MVDGPQVEVPAGNKNRIQVADLRISSEAGQPKLAEQAPQAEEAAATHARVDAAKQKAKDAADLLKKYDIDPRVVIRLLTDGGGVNGVLEGQAEAEIDILRAREDIGIEQKQKLAEAIQKRYEQLIKYSESRQKSTRELTKKLESSTKPEDKALLIDIKSTKAQIEQKGYREKVTQIEELLKTPNLNPEIKAKYNAYIEALNKKIVEIEENIEQLKKNRDGIKGPDGNIIPEITKQMALALTGGKVDDFEKANKEPIKYIQDRMVSALTTDGGMDKLADDLVESTLLSKENKGKFIEEMKLGLKADDIKDMMKSAGGKTALTLVGLLTTLGYVALQRRKQENQGQ
jgi:hypothetical protein